MVSAMLLMGFGSSVIDAVYPLFNRYALNHFVAGKTLDTLGIFITLYLLILIVQVIDNYVNIYFCGKVEMYLDRDLRNVAFSHLQKLSFSYFNQNNVGYIHARVMSDSGRIGEMVACRLMDLAWYGAYILSVLVVMLVINWRLACYVLFLVPIAVCIIRYFQKKLLVLNRKVREINAKITGDFNEGITGAKSMKTLDTLGIFITLY
ncbi:MAG: ABC transporter ATP-binding protein, partial [Blautia sp.]|nr:ABC transporter ATP-binding protein [Blautia sp.]